MLDEAICFKSVCHSWQEFFYKNLFSFSKCIKAKRYHCFSRGDLNFIKYLFGCSFKVLHSGRTFRIAKFHDLKTDQNFRLPCSWSSRKILQYYYNNERISLPIHTLIHICKLPILHAQLAHIHTTLELLTWKRVSPSRSVYHSLGCSRVL